MRGYTHALPITPQASFATAPFSFNFDQIPGLYGKKSWSKKKRNTSVLGNYSHPQKLSALQKTGRLRDVYSTDSMQQLDAEALKLEVVRFATHARLPRTRLFVPGSAWALRLHERTQALHKLFRKHSHAGLKSAFAFTLVCFELRALLRR